MEEFWKLFKEKTAKVPIFYISLDPERAVGVHDLMDKYHIICPFDSDFADGLRRTMEGRVCTCESFLKTEEIHNVLRHGSAGLLRHEGVQRYIRERAYDVTPCIVTFKNTDLFQEVASGSGFNILGPDAKVASAFEEKLSQFQLLVPYVPFPPAFVRVLGEVQRDELPPLPFILQFNRGHTGSSTIFIKSYDVFHDLQKCFPFREVKLCYFINGTPFTLNGLVLRNGFVISGSISLQLTGLPEATNNPNATVGNDFGAPRILLSDEAASHIRSVLTDVGRRLFAKGYRGIFGIDVIVEHETQKVYFIEVNARQVASVSFEASLHRRIDRVPIMAIFFFDQLGLEYEFTHEILPPLLCPADAKQIIYRNQLTRILSRQEIRASAPRGQNVLLTRMQNVLPGEEMYRIQSV